jgi:hypothetical protein|tara:strand:+ start:7101 stop:7904 length:804 start_codon:yes stop_codon:yes gene_type:complete
MAQPASRTQLADYCKRQLGAPVLEINVDDDQVSDAIDDALQYYRERHYDGVELMYLKHKITAADVTRFDSQKQTETINGTDWERSDNYLEIPQHVMGINKVFGLASNAIRNNLFGIEYQIFLNDLYAFGSLDMLNYFMVKQWLETIDMVLNNGSFVEFRFNQRQDRLYLDIDDTMLTEELYLIIQCYRALEPDTFTQAYNDPFVKQYATAKMKRQWGQNLIKFQGVNLPGGVQLNGRELFNDANDEIARLMEMSSSTYELPPMDMIG